MAEDAGGRRTARQHHLRDPMHGQTAHRCIRRHADRQDHLGRHRALCGHTAEGPPIRRSRAAVQAPPDPRRRRDPGPGRLRRHRQITIRHAGAQARAQGGDTRRHTTAAPADPRRHATQIPARHHPRHLLRRPAHRRGLRPPTRRHRPRQPSHPHPPHQTHPRPRHRRAAEDRQKQTHRTNPRSRHPRNPRAPRRICGRPAGRMDIPQPAGP